MKGMDENELIRQAMSVIGKRTSAAKKVSSRENGKRGGRPAGSLKPLSQLNCTCGGCPEQPKTTCPRGRAIRRRLAASQPLD